MRTAVLGAGKMGVWFARYYKAKGDTVVLSGRNQAKLAQYGNELGVETADFLTAVRDADRVLICVSISSFEEVVKKIAPAVHTGQPIMDICSIKEHPIDVMHKHLKDAITLGTHPVFGPGSSGIAHKAFILTPTTPKEEAYAKELQQCLENEQAHVFVMSPQKHDELMRIILGFPHFLGLAACETLLEQPAFIESKKLAGATYRMLFTFAESVVMESSDLYANLQTKLAGLDKVQEFFIASAEQWLDLMKKNDSKAIMERMDNLRIKLRQVDSAYGKSYEDMYRMLHATEA